MKALSLLALIMLVVTSCEVNITDQFNEVSGNQIILSGELTALTSPEINLSRSITMTDMDSLIFINDARIEIVSGTDSYQMISEGNGNYTAPILEIQPGSLYEVYCSHSDLPEASSSVRVPELPQVTDFSYSVDDEYWIHLELEFEDPLQVENYYSFAVSGWRKVSRSHYNFETHERTYDTLNIYTDYTLLFEDEVIEYLGGPEDFDAVEEDSDRGSMLHFSDRLINGAAYKLAVSIPVANMYNDTIPEVKVRFYQRDQHYFQFIQSLSKYNPDPDFPILQPIQIYSNIEGGFGLLSAESHREYIIDMSPWFEDPVFLDLLKP